MCILLHLQGAAMNSPAPLTCLDWSRVPEAFSTRGLKQEEIVNLGYKELVLNAFVPPVMAAKSRL